MTNINLSEIPSDELVEELELRGEYDKNYSTELESTFPMRYRLINLLNLSVGATLEEIIETVKEKYDDFGF